eukprot:scaffold30436_cov37-Prasinocladus_malaysianus.AAC.1
MLPSRYTAGSAATSGRKTCGGNTQYGWLLVIKPEHNSGQNKTDKIKSKHEVFMSCHEDSGRAKQKQQEHVDRA